MATYEEIDAMTPEQINKLFYEGYDLPRSMTLADWLNPASYVDPYKSLRVAPQQKDERGFTQLSNEQAQRVYNDPRYDPNVSANAQYDKLFGGNKNFSVSMPNFNLGNLTNYIPSASTIREYIPKEIPNVFGVNNPLYAGLLGSDQVQALSKQSNIAGLLGAAVALTQGMGRQGARRSPLQNIVNALASGYGSAGQAYQQGLQTYAQAQDLALKQRQQAGIQAMKLKYPDLADEFDTNPAGAFRIVAEREAAAKKPTVVSEGGTLVSPKGDVLFSAPKKPDSTSNIKDYQFYVENLPPGQKPKTFDQWVDTVKPSTNLSLTLPGDPAKRAQALSENSSKYFAYKPISEAFEVANRFDNFSKAYNNPQAGGASDAVLIYSMAKMLDPGGAVQQGDIGTIAGQKSIPERLQSIHQSFLNNRTLSDDQRDSLNAMAYSIVRNKQKAISPIIKQYRNYAAALASPDPASDIQDPFQNIELPKKRLVTINGKKTNVRLGNDGNYYYTDPTGKNYLYTD